MNHLYQIIL